MIGPKQSLILEPTADLVIQHLTLVPSEAQEHNRDIERTSIILKYTREGDTELTTVTVANLYPNMNWALQNQSRSADLGLAVKSVQKHLPPESFMLGLSLTSRQRYTFVVDSDFQFVTSSFDNLPSGIDSSDPRLSSSVQLLGRFRTDHDDCTLAQLEDPPRTKSRSTT